MNQQKARWCRKYVENNVMLSPEKFMEAVRELDESRSIKNKLVRLYRILKSGEKEVVRARER